MASPIDQCYERAVMGDFHTAQICRNGHVVTGTIDLSPDGGEKFCSKCGAETVSACPSCSTAIRGKPGGMSIVNPYARPNFCRECGVRFPWTQLALDAARELAESSDLSQVDKDAFVSALPDLVSETPQTGAAGQRAKNVLAKMKPDVANLLRIGLKEVVVQDVKAIFT